ncbi:hypothetical protein HPB50_001135 [Hyalomma asiaticum]|uniref:Uncharacterized protein n=1 Tax=Hyalomma asiaticum TaxID=266040 RepID=A0ACB7SJQ8_HYAAI|nr:hypothetical protein HPB50_001135 [Hyalomma asiaticum]
MPSASLLVKRSVPLSMSICIPSELAAVCPKSSPLERAEFDAAQSFDHESAPKPLHVAMVADDEKMLL